MTGRPRQRRSTTAGASPSRRKLALKKSPARDLDDESLPEYVTQYLEAQELAKIATERANKMKETLRAYVEEDGIEDEKGHLWVEVPGVGQLKHERRVSVSLDEDAIAAELKRSSDYKKVFKEVTIIQFDEEAFYGVAFDRKWSAEKMEDLKSENVTWAFRVTKS